MVITNESDGGNGFVELPPELQEMRDTMPEGIPRGPFRKLDPDEDSNRWLEDELAEYPDTVARQAAAYLIMAREELERQRTEQIADTGIEEDPEAEDKYKENIGWLHNILAVLRKVKGLDEGPPDSA